MFHLKKLRFSGFVLNCLILCCSIVFVQQQVLAMDVTLAWDANSETDLAGYKIYYGKIPGGPYHDSGSPDGASPIVVPLSSLLNPASPEFTVHGLASGTYCFVATAYDTEGFESLHSNEACTSPPNSPPNLAPILLLLLDD
jgi:hypothetical protein